LKSLGLLGFRHGCLDEVFPLIYWVSALSGRCPIRKETRVRKRTIENQESFKCGEVNESKKETPQRNSRTTRENGKKMEIRYRRPM